MAQVPPMFSLLAEFLEKLKAEDCVRFDVEDWRQKITAAIDGGNPGEALRILIAILPQLQSTGFARATKLLADGSRYEPWRLPFGNDGILDFYLDHLAMGQMEPAWTPDALRLIGNSCADIDVNRERVLAKIDLFALIEKLRSEDQVDLAIVVLNNLTFEYEPAEVATSSLQLFPALVDMLEHVPFHPDLVGQICQLLDFSSKHFDPLICSGNAVSIIYRIITTRGLEVDEQVCLAGAIVALLKHERFQKLAVVQDDLKLILSLIVYSYTQDSGSALDSELLSADTVSHKELDAEDEEQLSSMRQSLSGSLWDLSTLPDFASKYLPDPKCMSILISWLRASESQRQLCACYVLRNLASSDEASAKLIHGVNIHTPLIDILASSSDIPVLGEAFRLLKNLALPTENRPIIGSGQTIDLITARWSRFLSPTLYQAAVGLIRLLLKGCALNIYRFLRIHPIPEDISTSFDAPLFQLTSLYEGSTDLAVKVEVARTVVEIWRTAHVQDAESADGITRGALDRARQIHANIAGPIVTMIIESGNQSLVTEGWFGLSLIASSREGSELVCEALDGREAWTLLATTIKALEVAPQDRANARILLNKLLKNNPDNHAALAILDSPF